MRYLPNLLILASLLAVAPVQAESARTLLKENCTSCHGSDYYTRDNRIVTSRKGLTKQVRRCELALGLTWFDDQVEAVAEQLNRDHYHF